MMLTKKNLAIPALLLLSVLLLRPLYADEKAVVIAPPVLDNPKTAGELRKMVLAGGCFWGVQGVFQRVQGVRKVVSGYAGGNKANAHYEIVGTGTTGHAESVEITYDPAEVTYGTLLQVFFSVAHDPTQLNRQGPDRGTQYRSAIFFGDESEKKIAQAYIKQLDEAHNFPVSIVTRVDRLGAFYAAEDYHQDFLLRNPGYPYIVYNDLPKVEHLRQTFPELYSKEPTRITDVNSAPRMHGDSL